jgi:predicted nucleic acid-binding protein
MATDGRLVVVLDTSVLVNFLAVDRIDLLSGHPLYRFVVTDHVRIEVTEAYPDQLARLDTALDSLQLEQISVTSLEELSVFAKLSSDGRLGFGECAALAAGFVRGLLVAIDDKAARKRAMAHDSSLVLLDTCDIIIQSIKHGCLDVVSADGIKLEWETQHNFRLKFSSFKERV